MSDLILGEWGGEKLVDCICPKCREPSVAILGEDNEIIPLKCYSCTIKQAFASGGDGPDFEDGHDCEGFAGGLCHCFILCDISSAMDCATAAR
jgi:hypothetical protein